LEVGVKQEELDLQKIQTRQKSSPRKFFPWK
jgi:hypothetical protein